MKILAYFPILGCVITIAGIAYCQTSSHDLKITIRQTGLGRSSQTTQYWSGENSRSEGQFESGILQGHRHATIQRRGTDKIRVYDLDLDAKKYVTYQTDLRAIYPHSKLPAKPSGKSLVINISSEDTGERKEMFGLQARHIVTREKRIADTGSCYEAHSELETDGWYVDDDIFPEWQRSRGDSIVAALVDGQQCSDKIEVHRNGPRPGYPLLVKNTFTNKMTQADGSPRVFTSSWETEVLELSQAPLDARLFEVPSGFKKVDSLADVTK